MGAGQSPQVEPGGRGGGGTGGGGGPRGGARPRELRRFWMSWQTGSFRPDASSVVSSNVESIRNGFARLFLPFSSSLDLTFLFSINFEP